MQDLIGKRLRHVKEPNSIGKRVVKVENDTVYFEDNGRAPMSAINSVFEEVSNNPNAVNETYKNNTINSAMTNNQQPQQPQQQQQSVVNENIDPDSFFKRNSNSLNDLASQIMNIDTSQMSSQSGQGGSYVRRIEPTSETAPQGEIQYNPNDPNMNQQLNPNTVQNLKQQMNENQTNQPVAPHQDPDVLAQFGGNVDDGGAVRQVNADQRKENLHQAQNGMSVKQSEYVNPQPQTQQANSSPSFPPMKKNTKVVMKLEVEQMIPKPESVKNLNDLFEESIIDVLAREMTQEMLKNPEKLEALFVEELERIIYKKKKTSPRKTTTKTVAKKTAPKVEAKKTTKKPSTKKV